MNSRERIYRAIKNKSVDQIPFSFWKHFPEIDQNSGDFADAIVSFQKKFEFDLVKVTPSSGYLAEAFGGSFVFKKAEIQKGARECVSFLVKNNDDWKKIKSLNVKTRILGRELESIKLIRKGIEKNVPIVQTVPNAVTLARTLRGDKLFEDIKKNSRELKSALSAINKTILEFSIASLKSGADGIFFFTQLASFDFLTEKEYQKFGTKYDLQILNALKEKNALLVLHIHGLNIMFDLLKDYPAHIINWHDRLTSPSLLEAKKKFKGAVLGGVEEDNVLLCGNTNDIKNQVIDAVNQTRGKSLIIGPGCVLPLDLPDEKIMAVKEAIMSL